MGWTDYWAGKHAARERRIAEMSARREQYAPDSDPLVRIAADVSTIRACMVVLTVLALLGALGALLSVMSGS